MEKSSTTQPQKPSEAEARKKAIIIARTRSVPHDSARNQVSLAMQKRHGEEIAAELGAEVIREYTIVGGTTEAAVQVAVERVLQTLEAEDIVYLITSNVSRLTRRTDTAIRLDERLKATGARLVTDADPTGTGPTLGMVSNQGAPNGRRIS